MHTHDLLNEQTGGLERSGLDISDVAADAREFRELQMQQSSWEHTRTAEMGGFEPDEQVHKNWEELDTKEQHKHISIFSYKIEAK